MHYVDVSVDFVTENSSIVVKRRATWSASDRGKHCATLQSGRRTTRTA